MSSSELKPYTYSPQYGENGHCFSAQVWDRAGNSLAIVDGKDAAEATERAKFITDAFNTRTQQTEVDAPSIKPTCDKVGSIKRDAVPLSASSDEIERVARALWLDFQGLGRLTWDDMVKNYDDSSRHNRRAEFLSMAKAAIAALNPAPESDVDEEMLEHEYWQWDAARSKKFYSERDLFKQWMRSMWRRGRKEIIPVGQTEVVEAAQAVVDKCNSTNWKAEPTAGYMNRLRDALANLTQERDTHE